jgi:hypothetical protein
MTIELTKDLLLVMWNRSGVLLRKWRRLVLDVFKGHLMPEIKAVINAGSMNTSSYLAV